MSNLPFPDRVVHTVSGTPGTGACTLSSPAPGCQSLSNSASGIASGEYVTYEISDTNSVWEIGEGQLIKSAGVWTLTRTNVIESSAGLATAISATSAALVGITLRGIDIADFNCGFVNKFRNPGMDIAQRGTSGSVIAATAVYTLDGWYVNPTGAACAWAQEWGANMKGNALRLSCASGMTGCNILQRIESYLAADLLTDALAAQNVTITFLIYNNSGASITPAITVGYASARDNFATVDTDLSATNMQACPNGTLTKVSYTFTPANPSDWSNGIQVLLGLGGGLNHSTGYVDIGRADIRATPGRPVGLCYCPPRVESRPIHQERAFCWRYFYAWTPSIANEPSGCIGVMSAATGFRGSMMLPMPMCALPSVSFAAAADFSVFDGASLTVSAISLTVAGVVGLDLSATTSSGTAGHGAYLRDGGSNNSYIYVSAEL